MLLHPWSCEDTFTYLWYLLWCCYVPCSEFICKLFNIESTGDNSFQNGIFAFCCSDMVECCVFLHPVAYWFGRVIMYFMAWHTGSAIHFHFHLHRVSEDCDVWGGGKEWEVDGSVSQSYCLCAKLSITITKGSEALVHHLSSLVISTCIAYLPFTCESFCTDAL